MTFESYLEEKGATLLQGKRGEFNSYANVQRTWKFKNYLIQFGLFRVGDNNIIGLRIPFIDYNPTENFDDYLNRIINFYESGFYRGLIIDQKVKNFRGILVAQEKF